MRTLLLAALLWAPLLAQTAAFDTEAWRHRGAEGRWKLLEQALREHPAALKPWVDELIRRQEFQLVEWIALSQDWRLPARALAKADAPHWMRVYGWFLTGNDSHGLDEARSELTSRAPEKVRAWLDAHEATLTAPLRKLRTDCPEPAYCGLEGAALDIEHWLSDGNGAYQAVTEFAPDNIYIVEFWATWCGPCVASMPASGRVAKQTQRFRPSD